MKTYRQKHPYIAQIGYILRYKLQRFTWMFKVKDCRHICLFCEYFDRCKEEYTTETAGGGENDEHEKCNEK